MSLFEKQPRKRRTTTAEQKAIIKAHNESKNGLKLGPLKSGTKSETDTPLFKGEEKQTNLFGQPGT